MLSINVSGYLRPCAAMFRAAFFQSLYAILTIACAKGGVTVGERFETPVVGASELTFCSYIVVWRVTGRCDLGCHFCRFSRELPGPRCAADPTDVLRLGRLLADTGRETLVSWLGGEPTLWRPLWEVSRTLRGELGLRLGITTHGRDLASPQVCERLTELFDRVTVSLDGDGPFHDGVRQAPGLFDRLARGVTRLAQTKARLGRGTIIHVNTVLMRSNLARFTEICETAASWGAEELTFNELGGRDRPGPFFDREKLQPEDVAHLQAMLPDLRKRMAAHGLRICGDERYLDRLAASAAGQLVPTACCHPGRDFLFVDEKGTVTPCSFAVEEYGVPLAEITSADALRHLPERFEMMCALRPAPVCLDCRSTQVNGKFIHEEA